MTVTEMKQAMANIAAQAQKIAEMARTLEATATGSVDKIGTDGEHKGLSEVEDEVWTLRDLVVGADVDGLVQMTNKLLG